MAPAQQRKSIPQSPEDEMPTCLDDGLTPAQKLLTMTLGIVQTQLLNIAAQLNLADRLKDGPKPAMELAEATGMDPATFGRLLASLVYIGVLAETTPGWFSCTPMGALLQADALHSMRDVALTYGGEWFTNPWPRFIESVRSGTGVFEPTFGMKAYAYFDKNPDARAMFQGAMSSLSDQESIFVRDSYDFSSYRVVVDVGGGHGQLLGILLRSFPLLRGVLFDVPAVAESARRALQIEPFGEQCDVVGGDYNVSVPAGGDLYILKRILQSRTDAQVDTLLQNIRRAMAPGGRVLVAEPDNSSPYGRLLDMHMLVNFGGRLRTDVEIEALLTQSGFALGRTITTGSSTSLRLVEGISPLEREQSPRSVSEVTA
jgi:SAM-dependent methyltransferase